MLRVIAGVSLMTLATQAQAGTVTTRNFGQTSAGETVKAVTLANGRGMQVTLISLGAAVQSVIVPDRGGHSADVALGYPTIDGYLTKSEYFGGTVGRVANRIARGRFTLDGKVYQTPVNNGVNALHGGTKGFDKVVWRVTETQRGARPSVTFAYTSPDGDQGYPGTLSATATYSVDDAGVLAVTYRATTDKPTVVNLSNHSYWNLGGEGSAAGAMDHLLTIPADSFTPTDAGSIPTGEFRPVQGTVFDFRQPARVGARVRDADPQIVLGKGYDHNWVIARERAAAPRLLARVEEPVSGRVMEVYSDQPGLQFYSGNFLDGTVVGKAGKLYRQGDAIVLEPQMFPDTPNQPAFGSVRLDRGQTYLNHIEFRFSNR